MPNPKWYGATKPKLDQIIFRVITDATQEPIALQNNEVQVLFPQPQVDLVSQLQQIPNVSQFQNLGLTWEHYDFNLQNKFLADKALRQALFTAVNRQEIIDKTVGQFNTDVKPLNNHMFIPQQQGYQDNITATGQGTRRHRGGEEDPHRRRLHGRRYRTGGPGRPGRPDPADALHHR